MEGGGQLLQREGGRETMHSNCKEAKWSPSPNTGKETRQVADYIYVHTHTQIDMQSTGKGRLPLHTACESKASFSEGKRHIFT